LGDMAPRAIATLKSCDLVLCEDTRTSGILLKHFDITTPTASHHKFNEHTSVEPVVNRLKGGENIALISDAGTPGISDPGFMLVRECRRNDIEVETLPGPTALIPALVNSGLPCDRFVFEGFLPQKKGRATRIAEIAEETRTIIFYESPLRLVKTLQQLAQACGNDREASVSREISKIHDTTVTGTLQQLIEHFTMNIPRGEIVIVLSGKREKNARQPHRNKYRDNDDLNDA
ncbi:16S rRNA (cytidine(1402)-2'-O)-methyltransferase, partial [uncultured Muribaculum sp.]